MKTALWFAAALLLLAIPVSAQTDCTDGAPCYSAASITNGASFEVGVLAPYTCVSIFGTNLSDTTAALSNLAPGAPLPMSLGDASVLVNGVMAMMLYASPTQINFIIPIEILPGTVTIQTTRSGLAGPAVQMTLLPYAPGLFLYDEQTVLAIKGDWSGLYTPDAPAQPGDFVILYATGLGNVTPPFEDYEMPSLVGFIEAFDQFVVELNGVPVDPSYIFYAGSAPPFPGVYQINMQLPTGIGPNPQIQISIGTATSPTGFQIPVQ
ncbi:MAG: hypothetical protein ABSG25_15130 [Bryobacteraceae bacterium]